MRKQISQRTFLVLSVVACLITTSALAQTHSPNTPSSPIGTTGTMDPANSNMDQPNSGVKGSTSGTANSGLRDQAMQESDRNLNAQIREAFNRDSALREASHSVILTTNDGVVTLSGSVATEKEKKDLEDEIQLITGVSRVQNELQIAPSSSNSTTSPTTSIR
jgi:BON domain-containing protein